MLELLSHGVLLHADLIKHLLSEHIRDKVLLLLAVSLVKNATDKTGLTAFDDDRLRVSCTR